MLCFHILQLHYVYFTFFRNIISILFTFYSISVYDFSTLHDTLFGRDTESGALLFLAVEGGTDLSTGTSPGCQRHRYAYLRTQHVYINLRCSADSRILHSARNDSNPMESIDQLQHITGLDTEIRGLQWT